MICDCLNTQISLMAMKLRCGGRDVQSYFYEIEAIGSDMMGVHEEDIDGMSLKCKM